MPPKGVTTPEELFTAVLVNDPVMGIELNSDPKMLDKPTAIISCVASTVFPLAKIRKYFI